MLFSISLLSYFTYDNKLLHDRLFVENMSFFYSSVKFNKYFKNSMILLCENQTEKSNTL